MGVQKLVAPGFEKLSAHLAVQPVGCSMLPGLVVGGGPEISLGCPELLLSMFPIGARLGRCLAQRVLGGKDPQECGR